LLVFPIPNRKQTKKLKGKKTKKLATSKTKLETLIYPEADPRSIFSSDPPHSERSNKNRFYE